MVPNCIGEGLSCASTSGSACSCDDSNGGDERMNGNADTRFSDNSQMIRDCDKLIEIFIADESELTDWRKLLVNNNTKWSHIRLDFFRHCRDRADNENDPLMKNRMLLLGNKLKEIDADIQRHNQLIEMIKRTPSEITDIVSRNHLAKLRNTCLAAVKVHDTATESNEALIAAELNFQDIINSPMDASDQKIDNFAEKGKLAKARKVFDGMTIRDTVTWTAIIDGVDLALGKQIHACILKSNWRNLIVDSAIVNFYSKCGEITSAFRTFDRMEKRDVICWTTIITACSQHGLGHEALLMLSQMLGDGYFPNEYTICAGLKACGENKALKYGTQLHGSIIKKICKSDVFIGTGLIDMYAKCGEIVSSKKVFDRMRVRNTATWTSIISGYVRNGFSEEALNFFRVMKRKKVCKEYSHALNVLKHMPFRDVVSWTAIISGCARLGLETEALEFLREMIEEGVLPNSYTYSSALKACAKLEAPMQGKLIHSNASKTPALFNVFVNSALIYMYAKCGYIADAFQVFDTMPERNLVSWKAMILGYARNGHCRKALKLMYRMRAEGFVVDDYILATVLTACGGIDCGDIDWDLESSSHDLHSS
ncbi:hypothetical protein L195_g017518 [Trifolium pratense]|uniref:Pentatricopeptide repeat-containing protein n=1 Tax=Trifolium pratense TaxID=57577 RepID=A0A2K3MU58_TRIPR|nr:hypothetical protein L195_g017518 [Trifolium pratense]